MTKLRQSLRRWHIRLGWLVGLPVLACTLSGLVMAARPIETVRGEGLIAEAPALPAGPAPAPPEIGVSILALAATLLALAMLPSTLKRRRR